MVNISTYNEVMKYQKANIFDIFDAFPDTLKTNLPLSDPPANKRTSPVPSRVVSVFRRRKFSPWHLQALRRVKEQFDEPIEGEMMQMIHNKSMSKN